MRQPKMAEKYRRKSVVALKWEKLKRREKQYSKISKKCVISQREGETKRKWKYDLMKKTQYRESRKPEESIRKKAKKMKIRKRRNIQRNICLKAPNISESLKSKLCNEMKIEEKISYGENENEVIFRRINEEKSINRRRAGWPQCGLGRARLNTCLKLVSR